MQTSLSQAADARKNGMEKVRDIAVIAATLSGAALSIISMTPEKTTNEKVALSVGAAALITIGVVTLVNDVL